MRYVFENGKQKELILTEKNKRDLSWSKFAESLGIKYGKLCGYYYDGILLPEDIFDKFLLKEKFRRYIIDKRDNDWGRSKGGKNSSGGYIKKVNIPVESNELAELYGIMLGDGNLTRIKSYKVGTYQLKIIGDSRYDRDYLLNYVKPLIEKLFDIEVIARAQKGKNAIYLLATGKKLVEFFESKGFKPGDKIKNQLEIPNWIKENTDFLRLCLRGLYDTDGSVYKLTNQNSYQFSFRNYNLRLLNDVRDSILSLGIGISRVSKNTELTITRKSELRKFLNEVGFQNSRHLNKVKMFNLAP